MNKKVITSWGIEFGPIALFFISFELWGFIKATDVFVASTVIALLTAYILDGRLALFPLLAGASVIGFGSATIALEDAEPLIIKDTLYNGIFGVLLLVGILRGKGLLKHLFGELFGMTDQGWKILSLRWAIFFLLLTVGNEYIRMHYEPEVWVIYKFWATFATIVFGFYQITLARRERTPEDTNSWGLRNR